MEWKVGLQDWAYGEGADGRGLRDIAAGKQLLLVAVELEWWMYE